MNDSENLVHDYIDKIMPQLEKSAEGKILYPYLSVGCGLYYSGAVFCWDHYHMGIRFSQAGKPEYQKYLVDNLFAYQRSDGFTPSCLAKEGPYLSSPPFHAQPFLTRAALMYFKDTNDVGWLKSRYEQLKKYLNYYETEMRGPCGLFRWPISWMSGFDNDVATTFFQPETVISADINAWLLLEYNAASEMAEKLGYQYDGDFFSKKASSLRNQIEQMLWYDEVDSYSAYNLSRQQPLFHYIDKHLDDEVGYYSFQTCSNLIPLFAGIPSKERAIRMLKRYLLDENHFLSPYGIRSLSKSSEYYNNAVWGNPPRFGDHRKLTNSNWQGPVWIALNYFMFHALKKYGFISEAKDIKNRTNQLLAKSLGRMGSFAENFDGDTGKPLYASNFASWNILADLMK